MSERKSEFVFDWVEQSCLLSSASVAVIDENSQLALSYGDLLDKVVYLSEVVEVLLDRSADSSFESTPLVTLLCSRSLALVLSLLALLRLSVAVIPLDPLALERNSSEVSRSLHPLLSPSPQLLIVEKKTLPALLALQTMLPPLLVIEGTTGAIVELRHTKTHEPLAPVRTPASRRLAALHYSPTPLNHPTGALVTHKGLSASLAQLAKLLSVTSKDRLLFFNDLSLPTSFLEILLPLSCQATLVLADESSRRDPQKLLQLIARFDVTLMLPSYRLLDRLLAKGFQGKENLKLAVDCDLPAAPLPLHFLEVARRCKMALRLFSWPETCLASSAPFCPPDTSDSLPSPILSQWHSNIGHPLPSQHFLLQRENAEAVDLSAEEGELLISGVGLALGYLEEDCDRRFLSLSSKEWFRTGQVFRRNADGSFQFLRSLDDWVKYRGFRFSLSDVTSQLQAFPKIAQSLAVLLEGSLVGLVKLKTEVTYDDEEVIFSEIKDFLVYSLPFFMIPESFLILETIPTVPSGLVLDSQKAGDLRISVRRSASVSEIGLNEKTSQADEVEPAAEDRPSFFEILGDCFLCPRWES